jgi:hypothetical protein
VFCAPVTVAQADDWDWSITPYAWLIGTEFTTTVDIPEEGEQKFSDIGENLDFAAQLHLEGRGDRLGILLDITNLQLSDSGPKNDYVIRTDSRTTLLEAAATWSLQQGPGSETILFLGTRLLDVQLDLEVLPAPEQAPVFSGENDEMLVDVMLGVRHRQRVSDHWSLLARADFASGDTDFSWNASLVAARKIGESGQFLVGYRYLNVEFRRGDELLDPTLVVSGPMFGYSFKF